MISSQRPIGTPEQLGGHQLPHLTHTGATALRKVEESNPQV